MPIFELGNPETIAQLVGKPFSIGKFVFRADDTRYRLFMGEFNSHPEMVERLGLLHRGESGHRYIWGGGEFEIDSKVLKFRGSSSTYGQVPNSFLIDSCRNAKILEIDQFVFALAPYSLENPVLKEIRETWRNIGGYELDTERKAYVFDANMNPIL